MFLSVFWFDSDALTYVNNYLIFTINQGGPDSYVGMIGSGAITPGQLVLITGSSHLQLTVCGVDSKCATGIWVSRDFVFDVLSVYPCVCVCDVRLSVYVCVMSVCPCMCVCVRLSVRTFVSRLVSVGEWWLIFAFDFIAFDFVVLDMMISVCIIYVFCPVI